MFHSDLKAGNFGRICLVNYRGNVIFKECSHSFRKGVSVQYMSKNCSPQRLLVLNHILHPLELILCLEWITSLHFCSLSLDRYLSKSQKYNDAKQMMKVPQVRESQNKGLSFELDAWEGRWSEQERVDTGISLVQGRSVGNGMRPGDLTCFWRAFPNPALG